MPAEVPSTHPIYVLREIADLIKRVPDWHLQIAFGCTRPQKKFHPDPVPDGVSQGNSVLDRPRLCREGVLCSCRSRYEHSQSDEGKRKSGSG